MYDIRRIVSIVLTACGLSAALAGTAHAGDASAWSEDSRSAMRLIAGHNAKDGPQLRAGIEVKMQSGWHTYWRYPGDAGVPPRFDFAGSENVKTAKVLYPAPQVHSDSGGQSLGYVDRVIFPIQVTPKEPGKPVKLRLKLDYAVCEKLCVPAEGKAEIPLSVGDSAQESALQAAEARVPRPAAAADLGLTARRVSGGAKPLVMLELAAPGDGPVQVFAEGPSPEWALPIPQAAQGAPAGRRHFSFTLDGLPGGVDPKGAFDLTFTVVTGERAYEVVTRLD